MATIREVEKARTGGGWQAIVRRRGQSLSRVLTSKKDAESWARRVEAAIDVSGPDRPFDRTAWLPTATMAHVAKHGTFRKAQPEADPNEQAEPSPRWTLRRALEHYESTVLPGQKAEWKVSNCFQIRPPFRAESRPLQR